MLYKNKYLVVGKNYQLLAEVFFIFSVLFWIRYFNALEDSFFYGAEYLLLPLSRMVLFK